MAGAELIGAEEQKEINEVLETGVLMRYEFHERRKGIYKVAAFEQACANYLGAAHTLGVTSGTAALKVALTALDVGHGDEVIVPAFDFIATYEAVLEVGAIPVMTDIDDTFNLDPDAVEGRLSERTKAIIPVHMCGAAARIEELCAVARKHSLLVLEDNAQAFGGTVGGKQLGTFGDMGILSFDYFKTITTGEGGMVITDREDLYNRADWYHDHGHDHNPAVGRAQEGRTILGFNYRMNELQGAVGLAQLRKLDFIIAEQKKNKAEIKAAAARIPGVTFRRLVEPAGDTATFLAVTFPDAGTAQEYQAQLKQQGVDTVCFKENAWHYAPRWEHLIAGATANSKGYPFTSPLYTGTAEYSVDHIPRAEDLLGRSLFMAIPVIMTDERKNTIIEGIERASRTVAG